MLAAAAAAHTIACAAAAHTFVAAAAGSAGVQKAAAAHPDSALETAKPRLLAAKPGCSAAAVAAPAGQLQPALATKQNHVSLAFEGFGTALVEDHQTAPKRRCWGS